MVKPEQIDHLRLVYHFTVPLIEGRDNVVRGAVFTSSTNGKLTYLDRYRNYSVRSM